MNISWTWLGIAVLLLIAGACVSGFRKGFVKEIVSVFFLILSFLLVWVINPYVNTFIKEYTPVYRITQEKCQELVEKQVGDVSGLNREEQTKVVEELELPDLLKNTLMKNNTIETYRYLAVTTFTEYVSHSLAVMLINGISFLLSYALSAFLIKLLGYILNILASLPIIHGVNKIAGGIVGGGKCVIFLWIAFLLLTLLCNTSFGKMGMELIQKDTFLSFLYNENIFVKIYMNVFY